MTTSQIYIALVAVVLIVGGGAYVSMRPAPAPEAMMEKQDSAAMMEQKGDAMMEVKGDTMMEKKDDAVMQQAGMYDTYAPEKVASATGKIALFFHATWCPTCRSLDAAIKADLASIPADVTILKVDYDSNTALRKIYGVTQQHTIVQVTSDGSKLGMNTGARTIADIVASLK